MWPAPFAFTSSALWGLSPFSANKDVQEKQSLQRAYNKNNPPKSKPNCLFLWLSKLSGSAGSGVQIEIGTVRVLENLKPYPERAPKTKLFIPDVWFNLPVLQVSKPISLLWNIPALLEAENQSLGCVRTLAFDLLSDGEEKGQLLGKSPYLCFSGRDFSFWLDCSAQRWERSVPWHCLAGLQTENVSKAWLSSCFKLKRELHLYFLWNLCFLMHQWPHPATGYKTLSRWRSGRYDFCDAVPVSG